MASAWLRSVAAKKLRRERPKGALGGDQDLPRILAAPGNVEEPEQHACGTDAQKLVKITRHALPVIDGGDLGIRESGDVSVEWIDR